MSLLINLFIWTAYLISLYFSVFLFLVFLDQRKSFKLERSDLNPPQTPLVSIIVPAYNEEKTIVRTLESIENLDYPKELLEVVVVNDGSKDQTKARIEQYIKDKPQFRLLSHSNRGKAASMNRALTQIKGEFFACLDADSFVHPLTLRKMLSLYYQKNDPRLAIITPAMKVHEPKNMLQKVQWLEYLVIILIARISSHLDSLYVAPGPFSLYRTAIVRKLGGFDEKSIVEDQDIAYKVQQHHYRIIQCPDGYVYTTAPKKIKPFYKQRRRWYLGSVSCLNKYRGMIANKKYGDFGIMQMVKNVIGYVLALAGIGIFVYLMLVPVFEKIRDWYLIRFDFWPYLSNLKIDFTVLDFLQLDFRLGVIMVLLSLIGALLFIYAHRNAQEKINRFGWLPLLPYFLFYYLLKGTILILSMLEFARGKKTKW